MNAEEPSIRRRLATWLIETETADTFVGRPTEGTVAALVEKGALLSATEEADPPLTSSFPL